MRFFAYALLIPLIAVFGCSRPITPKYVYPQRYTSYSCDVLIKEKKHLLDKLQKLGSALDKENSDSSGGVSFDYNRTIVDQISMSEGELQSINEVIFSKHCLLQ